MQTPSVFGLWVVAAALAVPVAGDSALARNVVIESAFAPDVHFVRYVRDTGIDGDLDNITLGPDGALWFTEEVSDAIGRLDRSGHLMNFPVPSSAGNPDAITVGPDGNLWFTLDVGNLQGIGRITTAGKMKTYPFGTPFGMEVGITAGPDGNVWFSDTTNNKIGRITPRGTITEFAIPGIGQPWGITLGPDRNLWISEYGALQGSHNEPGRILRMTTAGKFSAFVLSPPSWTTAPQYIAVGPDDNLWFSEQDYTSTPYHIERITTSGKITAFALPPKSNEPGQLAVGADHNLWVSEPLTYIDRVTTTGKITRFAMPQPPHTSLPAQPRGIVWGPANDLWWVETSTGSIGILNPL